MNLYALDPGTNDSALVQITDGVITTRSGSNQKLLDCLWLLPPGHMVIEEVESYGMPVGREVFATVFWAGRFAQAWGSRGDSATWSMLPRRTVKLTLCGSSRAKDPNVRRALIDRYGGDSSIRKGGPLYGIKTHSWAALALAVTYTEVKLEQQCKADKGAIECLGM